MPSYLNHYLPPPTEPFFSRLRYAFFPNYHENVPTAQSAPANPKPDLAWLWRTSIQFFSYIVAEPFLSEINYTFVVGWVVSLPPFFVRSLNPLLSWPSTYCTVHVLEVLMMNASHSLALQVKCGRTFLAFDVISRGGYQVGQFMSRETKYGVSSSVYEVESYLNCLWWEPVTLIVLGRCWF
jgi:hypothetical protein